MCCICMGLAGSQYATVESNWSATGPPEDIQLLPVGAHGGEMAAHEERSMNLLCCHPTLQQGGFVAMQGWVPATCWYLGRNSQGSGKLHHSVKRPQ